MELLPFSFLLLSSFFFSDCSMYVVFLGRSFRNRLPNPKNQNQRKEMFFFSSSPSPKNFCFLLFAFRYLFLLSAFPFVPFLLFCFFPLFRFLLLGLSRFFSFAFWLLFFYDLFGFKPFLHLASFILLFLPFVYFALRVLPFALLRLLAACYVVGRLPLCAHLIHWESSLYESDGHPLFPS